MTATIYIDGLDRLLAKLNRLGKMEDAKTAMQTAAKHVMDKARIYPTYKHIPMRWQSEKQRRWFFAALRTGSIRVPYKRGPNLRRHWKISLRDGGLTASINNDTPYGKFVMGTDSQYWMHKAIGWKTEKQIADEERRVVVDFVTAAIRKAL